MTRLARKELRTQIEPLRKANSSYRRDIASLKREVATLQRQVAVSNRAQAKVARADPHPKPTRFVAKGLRSLRARLGLSATDFGKLAGASGQSIYNWESGKAVPRRTQTTVLSGLRGLSKKEAEARLLAMTTTPSNRKTGASKRG